MTSAQQGAGIQLAIWDIVEDGGDGFSAGSVQAVTDTGNPEDPNVTDPNVLRWARFYEWVSKGKSSDSAFVYQNVNMPTGQPAQMLEGPLFLDGGPVPAPEPSTFALAGLALMGICKLALARVKGD